MKAWICERYGGPEVLQLKEIATPLPQHHEVLIKIHATTVTSGDWRVRSLTVPHGFRLLMRLALGLNKPRQPVLGTELAGVVQAVGQNVSRFKPGDAVFAFSDFAMGCHAAYKCMSQNDALALVPRNLNFEEAAALSFGGTTALDFFRRAQLKAGEKMLVNGASGSVGTAAVQLAKHFGAEVTGVCSGDNLALVKALGADHVIDYTQDDILTFPPSYDLILDTVGNLPYSRSKPLLKSGGRLLMVAATLTEMLKAPWVSVTTRHKLIAGPVSGRAEDVRLLADLAAAGRLRPVIDHVYPFEQIAKAYYHVATRRKKGNVVITLQGTSS